MLDAPTAKDHGILRLLPDPMLADIPDPQEDPLGAPRAKDFPGETFRVLKRGLWGQSFS